MFKSARLKLAGWYLLITAVVVIFFSGIIYFTLTWDLARGFRGAGVDMVFKLRGPASSLPPHSGFFDLPLETREEITSYFEQNLKIAKNNILRRIIFIDFAILSFSAFLGYFLAGRTLAPIEKAMAKQKRFVSDASHELRTPLTALKTATEVVLRDRKLTISEAKKILKDNLEEVDNLSSLINKLLLLTSYQENGQVLDKSTFSLRELIGSAGKKIAPLAKKKKVSLEFELASGKITADRAALEGALLVFLDNAVKYTPAGGKILVTTKKTGKNWQILVKDNGIGIAQKDLPYIFERFWRADQARQKQGQDGYGLGLALGREIIELHRGKIKVTSEIGTGTTFTINLPQKTSF
jgi:two-component system, OmpR family, sensor histidine kinase CiaH